MKKKQRRTRYRESHHARVYAGLVASLVLALGAYTLAAGLTPRDLTSGITATDLANTIVGTGVTISNVRFKGDPRSAGTFTDDSGAVGLGSGIVLSTGAMKSVVGPNRRDGTSLDLGAPSDATPRAIEDGCADPGHQNKKTLGLPGDDDLTHLSGFTTCDATVLELDFVPDKDRIFLKYVFSSEEYNEFVNTSYNDVFAFLINGNTNCATVDPGHQLPVSINTINNGGPGFLGQPPVSHSELYINNDRPPFARNTEMDGLTRVLTCQAAVIPRAVNHLKLAIADATDPTYDSNVFLAAGSLTTTPPLTIIKKTNGTDNDLGTGPYILAGPNVNSPVAWTYDVTNNSGSDVLTGVTVSDSKGVSVSCPSSTLAAGATMRCTGSGIAVEGQYTNVGTVTGTSAIFGAVTDSNPDHYFGARPGVAIVTKTNFTDYDLAPGPSILVDSLVTWTYEVTNTGNVPLTNLTVIDTSGVTVDCSVFPGGLPKTTLLPGETLTCMATGVAKAGPYENVGRVTGTPPGGLADVTASNSDHYFGANPKMSLMKTTNGTDNDLAPGAYILVGDPVAWTYVVTNIGNVPLTDVVVSDDKLGAICTIGPLAVDQTSTACAKTGTAAKGPYENTGTVTGKFQDLPVTAVNLDHYFGAQPAVSIVKKTNGVHHDSAPGAFVLVGDPVTWTYVVTNTGNVPLTNAIVTDDQLGAICTIDLLKAGDSASCPKVLPAVRGQHDNIGSVTATAPVGPPVTARDTDHYFGAQPAMALVKKTNGVDHNTAPGQYILVGDAVDWTYAVTNTGNVLLTDVAIADDKLGAICTVGELAVDATFTCPASGVAARDQYENTGTATATAPIGPPVTATDLDHYFGAQPAVSIVKKTNGTDHDSAPGAFIAVGGEVIWTFVVTNTGNVPLTDVTVTDDRLGAVCTIGPLKVGDATSCTKPGVAVKGQHDNTATVTATAPIGPRLTAKDSDYYFGADPKIAVVKKTNGTDNAVAPGPMLLFATPVGWTYELTNTGNVALTNITVTDSKGVPVVCPVSTLAPAATTTCTGAGSVVEGPYENLGTVTATPPGGLPNVKANDVEHYFGARPSVAIVKKTNGTNNDAAPGPFVLPGTKVTWTYEVTNTGNVPLTGLVLTDSMGVPISCLLQPTPDPDKAHDPKKRDFDDRDEKDDEHEKDAEHDHGRSERRDDGSGGIGRDSAKIGDDSDKHDTRDKQPWDTQDDHDKQGGDTHDGRDEHDGRDHDHDRDDHEHVGKDGGDHDDGDKDDQDHQPPANVVSGLAPGATITCTGSGTAVTGQYENVGTVMAKAPIGPPLSASNVDHYFGAKPAIAIVKKTNGANHDSKPGALVLVGDTVTWTFAVTNTGNVPLTDVTVTDDKLGPICTIGPLAVKSTTACTKTATAVMGQHKNTGTATGTPPVGPVVTASDDDYYFGAKPAVAIVKKTDGTNNDRAPGPSIVVGKTVTWTYEITNTGNVPLTGITVTDSKGVAVTCPAVRTSGDSSWKKAWVRDFDDHAHPSDDPVDGLAVGATIVCSGSGKAVLGQYENIGTVTATPPVGPQVTASDVDHYLGVNDDKQSHDDKSGRKGFDKDDHHDRDKADDDRKDKASKPADPRQDSGRIDNDRTKPR